MGPEDFRLKKRIEAILVRNYVVTQKMNVDVISGNVYLDGEFEVADYRKIARDDQEADQIEVHFTERRTLLAIEQEIRSLQEVNGLYFEFKNWVKSGGGWAPKKGG
ncbi:MAG: hypothetical protein HY360_14795 [Verrucomicrobia bacterium]|nr:hypothetical protein [Verrucomicrobiota bacterium]